MFLTLDVGNTNIVIGAHLGPHTQSSQLTEMILPFKTWRISTHPIGTSDEFKVKLKTLLEMEDLHWETIEAAIVSSVVPRVTGMLRGVFSKEKLRVIDYQWKFSFTSLADPPHQVGADRLVNAEAVVREFGYPAIIVDSGTATTLCAISKKGEYLGGAIMPGIELSVESLAKRAAKLFSVELTPPQKAIGKNTEEALKSGIILGYASMIDGLVKRFKEEIDHPSTPVIATGGVSALLKGICTELTHYDPDLTSKGIAYLYETNFLKKESKTS